MWWRYYDVRGAEAAESSREGSKFTDVTTVVEVVEILRGVVERGGGGSVGRASVMAGGGRREVSMAPHGM